jgi:hypothetical protein
VRVCVYMYVRTYVRMYVCMCEWVGGCMYDGCFWFLQTRMLVCKRLRMLCVFFSPIFLLPETYFCWRFLRSRMLESFSIALAACKSMVCSVDHRCMDGSDVFFSRIRSPIDAVGGEKCRSHPNAQGADI